MSDFYDHTGFPSTGSAGLSAAMRAEFTKLETAFGKFPALSGNDGKALVVTGGGASVGVTSGTLTLSGNLTKAASHSLTLTTTATTSLTLPTTGTLATLAGSETLTNKVMTSPTLNTATINSPIFTGTTAAGTLQGSYALVTSAVSGHAIGTSPLSTAAMVWVLSKTGAGGSEVNGLYSFASITGGVGDSIRGHLLTAQINRASSGTHTNADNVLITTPSNIGSATVTTASTLRVTGAPSFGTNNYALKIDAGGSRFDGLVDLGAGQLKFPSTQNASADANTLDDYEEGTWTPNVGGSATYTTQTGTYTKIGRLVFIRCILTINSIGTGSTGTISGLPFTAASGEVALAVGDFTNLPSSMVSLVARVNSAANSITVEGLSAAAATPNVTVVIGSGTYLLISGVYHV